MPLSATEVQLRFDRSVDEDGFCHAMTTRVVSGDDEQELTAGAVSTISAWLRDHGFQWVTGSNGVWARS